MRTSQKKVVKSHKAFSLSSCWCSYVQCTNFGRISSTVIYLDGSGKKRKASGKNAPEGISQHEEATEAEETQQVTSLYRVILLKASQHAHLQMTCIAGAAGKGERKRESSRCQFGSVQTLFQRAGHGGAQCSSVWFVVPLAAGL